MTKPNFTALALIVDESGSMLNTVNDTVGGISTFLTEQRKVEGEATVTLVKFNDKPTYVMDFVDLQTAPAFTAKQYKPNRGTALYDAIGITVKKLGERLAAMPEDQRPSSVVVAILTDGEENESKEYTSDEIAKIIKHQTEVYSWQFLFLGANQDAILAAGKLGIAAGASMTYTGSSVGTRSVYTSVSNSVTRGRKMASSGLKASYGFTEQDRQDYAASVEPAPTVVSTPTPAPVSTP